MKTFDIGYVTEDPSKEYGEGIRKAETKEALVEFIMPYRRVADDALHCAKNLTDTLFAEFRNGLKDIHREDMPQAWIERFVSEFGDIVMPRKMMHASMVADQFHVPWGTAFIRCEDMGWDKIFPKK